MRTTITLADDVYRAVKTLADTSGRTIGEVVSELTRRALQPQASDETLDALPVFSVPANSTVIPGSRAAELLAEEGVE
jgi:hypothetical protein